MSADQSESNKLGCVCWVEVPVKDMKRAIKFYETVFPTWKFTTPDFNPDKENPFYCTFMNKGSSSGGGFRLTKETEHITAPDSSKKGFANRIVFSVEDCNDAIAVVEKSGGRAVDELMHIGEDMGWTVAFQDTEGNVNGLWAMNNKTPAK